MESEPSTSTGITSGTLARNLEGDLYNMMRYSKQKAEKKTFKLSETTFPVYKQIESFIAIRCILAIGQYILCGQADGRITVFKGGILEQVQTINLKIPNPNPVTDIIQVGRYFFAISGVYLIKFYPEQTLNPTKIEFPSKVLKIFGISNRFVVIEELGHIWTCENTLLFDRRNMIRSESSVGKIKNIFKIINEYKSECFLLQNENQFAFICFDKELESIKFYDRGQFETTRQDFEMLAYGSLAYYTLKYSNKIMIKELNKLAEHRKGQIKANHGIINYFDIVNGFIIMVTRDAYIELITRKKLVRLFLICLKEQITRPYFTKIITVNTLTISDYWLFLGNQNGNLINVDLVVDEDNTNFDRVDNHCISLFPRNSERTYRNHICIHQTPVPSTNRSSEANYYDYKRQQADINN